MLKKISWLMLPLASGLTSCMVGPDYHKAEPKAPVQWQAGQGLQAVLEASEIEHLKNWWKGFHDETLDDLMAKALADNLDVKIALARVEQARAGTRQTRSGLFPSISLAPNVQRQVNPFPGLRPGIKYNLFNMGFDAVWEIDLFGRQRRLLEAASAEYDIAGEQYAQAVVVLTSELARNYIQYRNLQNQLKITRSNLDAMRETLALTQTRFDEGLATRFDVVRASAQVKTIEAQIPTLEADKTAMARQLDVLTGQYPGALQATLSRSAAIPRVPGQAMLASPADTLRSRPDIRTAERRLAAATAMQGAAIAQLFPNVSVSAFLGFRNTSIDALYKSASFSYSTAATLVQPLLNFGRIQAGIDQAKAQQKEAFLAYKKSILVALQETETAVTRYLKEEIRRQRLANSVVDHQESVYLSKLRYQEGVTSLLDVLEAQRALYAVESELAESKAATGVDLIALYKSLGGGVHLSAQASSSERS